MMEDMLMILLYCLKNRYKFCRLLTIWTNNIKTSTFRLYQKVSPFLHLVLQLVEKQINPQQVFSEKMHSVVHTLILAVS